MSNGEQWRDLRDRMVLATLAHVPFEGWSPRALSAAAKDEGLDPTIGERLFPDGPVEAIAHFSDLADRRLGSSVDRAELDGMRHSERIRWLVRARIEAWTDQREAVRRAVTYLTLPVHAKVAACLGWRTADAIWHVAGDTAADFSYYTKRATLGAVFTATLLYWLQDESEGCADSWAFLDRRLADALRLTQLRTTVRKRAAAVPNPLQFLFPKSGQRRRFGVHQG